MGAGQGEPEPSKSARLQQMLQLLPLLVLGETSGLTAFYRALYEYIRSWMDAETFIVSLYDRSARTVSLEYAVHGGQPLAVHDLAAIGLNGMATSLQGQVIASGESLSVPNYPVARGVPPAKAPGTIGPFPLLDLPEAPIQSAISVPMKLHGETVGALECRSPRPAAFTEAQVDLLAALANVVAISVENARLHRASQEELSDRRRIEEALRASLERLQELEFIVNKSPAVVFLWRAEPGWPVEFVSENVAQFGYTAEEFVSGGLPYADIVCPEDLARVAEEVERYTAEGRAEFFQEYRILTRSGEVRWVDDRTWVRRAPDGRVTHYQGIVLDITERKRTQAELQRQRDLARTLIEASPAFFVAIAPDGRTIAMNEAMLSALGYTPEEVEGTDYLQTFVPPEDRAAVAGVFERLVRFKEPTVNENRVRTRDGRLLWVEWHGTPVLRPDGALDYFFGIGIDVTERKKTQQELEQRCRVLSLLNRLGPALGGTLELEEVCRIAHEYVSQIVDCAYFGISLYDRAERVLRAGFVLADGQVLDTSAFPPLRIEEGTPLVGRARALLAGEPEVLEDLDRARAAAATAGKPVYEIGEGEVPLSAVYVPMWVAGEVTGLLELQSYRRRAYGPEHLALLKPVANQIGLALANARLYEQVREQARELERRVAERTAQLQAAIRELEAFSYSVSHDLRAPLRAVTGFAQVLKEGYGACLDDPGRHYLDEILRQAARMERLIADLLAFSRLTRQPLRCEPVCLRELVQEAWLELAPEREGREVELSVGDLPVCEGDPLLLRQVFFNLLSNALKFTRPREVARIEVGCRPAATPEAPGQPVIYVRDNGVGFDMRYAGRLFGVFQRLHREEEFEGTGVGLAIVQRIVQRHGGEVWAKGEVGKGATFFFTLGGKP